MIRQYNSEDNKAVRYVCHTSSTTPAHKASLRLVCLLYADYYLAQDKSHAFVATDEFDKPVGYVLCETNYQKYTKLYPTYIAETKRESRKDYKNCLYIIKNCQEISKDYPAHLQMNVLPSFQNRGIGKSLVETEIARLRGEGICGVHVVLKQSNKGAIAFFERLGFTKILRLGRKFYVLGVKI